MINLKIDGKDVQIASGATILDAAAQVGIKIPTLCYLKKVSPTGACRICAVEVEGADKAREFVSMPALQAMGSRYGKQQCSKLVDWGVYACRIEAGHVTPIRRYIQTIGAQASKPQII